VTRIFKDHTMKELTIREAREGLSHPEIMFAEDEEVLVVRRGEPVARILPVNPKRKVRSLKAFLASQPMQTVPSEDILAEEREDRC
jgi:antitoxin (DNA-binding transcriptional repressor) of toxin-antitoxin stability system